MKTFHTQKEFLKEFPIIDGVINCKSQNLNLLFNLNVQASIVYAWDIEARDIEAWDIKARNIKARNINARNIEAWDIEAWDIEALENIEAWDIEAWDISFYAVCFAYNNIECKSIGGRRKNSRYFSLDGKIIINGVTQENN